LFTTIAPAVWNAPRLQAAGIDVPLNVAFDHQGGDSAQPYQKRLQELYAEERAERVSAWRDISKLRQLLPESIRQYLSSYRKSQILNDLPGDLP
jgi:hypothetical protein